MICRHPSGYHDHDLPTGGYPFIPEDNSPDPKNYDIQEIERIGHSVVMKVKYPSCKKCAYEGNKIMVFLNVLERDILKWKEIDPHFRKPQLTRLREAPSPAARFPASDEGWKDAIEYAKRKQL